MATDYWPTEELAINVWGDFGFAYADGAITEGKPVKLGTSAASRVAVAAGAAKGDAIGIALKAAAAAGDYIPVALSGIVKVVVASCPVGVDTVANGDFVMNSATWVVPVGLDLENQGKAFGGSSYVLGLALQAGTTDSDEILILLGRSA